MKILLYARAFHPMVGGIETVSATMAGLFNQLGHECSVLTPVENSAPDPFSYRVHRNPGLLKTLKLVRAADIVISKGASMAMIPYCLLLCRPFIWIHSGYQASCIDGLGWVEGEAAPLTPNASIAFHYQRSGVRYATIAALKLYLRRFACRHIVAMNVAVTDWVAMRQPFAKQIRIYNPFPIYRFAHAGQARKQRYDFFYLGRLVSEKGVATLVRAFDLVVRQHPHDALNLLIIGDGSWRYKIEALVSELALADRVVFAGRKTGTELVELIQQCAVAVVPSEWEEAMGGVALELLAAGKPVIASKRGGLAECVGDAGLLFENGDHKQLAACMSRLHHDEALRNVLLQKTSEQVKRFDPEKLAKQYIDLFNRVLGREELQTIQASQFEASEQLPSA
ncbi:MAG: glycosyltransferase family 4 protein [Pyrinomonadaceae bacterium]